MISTSEPAAFVTVKSTSVLLAPVWLKVKSLVPQAPVHNSFVLCAPAPAWVTIISTSSLSVAMSISVVLSVPVLDEFSVSAISISSQQHPQ